MEAAIVVPLCFLITIVLITSTAKLYEETESECYRESLVAVSRRDSKENWIYKVHTDEEGRSIRKSFSLNPVKLIDKLSLINDSKNIFNDNTGILESLKGIIMYEK